MDQTLPTCFTLSPCATRSDHRASCVDGCYPDQIGRAIGPAISV